MAVTKEIEGLVKFRDGLLMAAEGINEYIDSKAPKDKLEGKTQPTVVEETFKILKFESQQGSKIGGYEVAYANVNIQDKWQQAYNILRANNATIADRYHGDNYEFSYWLYGEGKIYRQKRKTES